ncbi:MAG: Rid family hydrolase [Bacteroidales bacterium]|nr:Rid family hydrolase [Bacteroidales bacterium]
MKENIKFNLTNVSITSCSFQSTNDEHTTTENHMVLCCNPFINFEAQLDALFNALQQLTDGQYGTCLFIRFFLSDASNQVQKLQKKITNHNSSAVISIIQQPPLDGSKIAAWCYFATNMQQVSNKQHTLFSHNGYQHLWSVGKGDNGSAFDQTHTLLGNEEKKANELEMSIKENCIRTWFYVQNIDVNYMGMVKARKEFFEQIGLTNKTHFIASTGIEGKSDSPSSFVRLDSYYVKGLQDGQIQYLQALSHLNPTYEYGVTFERATAVHYGDRKHIFLSGTASINNKGEILYEGDIEKQTYRMWENCDALLHEANGSLDNLVQMLIYIRDTADYHIVKQMFDKRFPDTPKVIVLAPVCRPGWLIEMEGIAIIDNKEKAYSNY